MEFEEDGAGCKVCSKPSPTAPATGSTGSTCITGSAHFCVAASHLQLDASSLEHALTTRVTHGGGAGLLGERIEKALGVDEARCARDALAKCIYTRLFDHMVLRVNGALPFQTSAAFIGILDIAGFGIFSPTYSYSTLLVLVSFRLHIPYCRVCSLFLALHIAGFALCFWHAPYCRFAKFLA